MTEQWQNCDWAESRQTTLHAYCKSFISMLSSLSWVSDAHPLLGSVVVYCVLLYSQWNIDTE